MRPEELAVLHYTSGSTGKLKAAMQTVGNRFASLRKIVMGRMHAGPGDVLMLCGPITHASGMFIQPMLFQGATILLMERFQPAEILEAIETHRVTICFLVPAMIHALLAEPIDPHPRPVQPAPGELRRGADVAGAHPRGLGRLRPGAGAGLRRRRDHRRRRSA